MAIWKLLVNLVLVWTRLARELAPIPIGQAPPIKYQNYQILPTAELAALVIKCAGNPTGRPGRRNPISASLGILVTQTAQTSREIILGKLVVMNYSDNYLEAPGLPLGQASPSKY